MKNQSPIFRKWNREVFENIKEQINKKRKNKNHK